MYRRDLPLSAHTTGLPQISRRWRFLLSLFPISTSRHPPSAACKETTISIPLATFVSASRAKTSMRNPWSQPLHLLRPFPASQSSTIPSQSPCMLLQRNPLPDVSRRMPPSERENKVSVCGKLHPSNHQTTNPDRLATSPTTALSSCDPGGRRRRYHHCYKKSEWWCTSGRPFRARQCWRGSW